MTQEEIRKTWQDAATHFYTPAPNEFEMMYRERKETALEKLANKYKTFSRIGLIMMIMSCCYLTPNSIFPDHMKIWLGVGFMFYFGLCSVMDYWLYKGVSSIDCYTMSVKEVIDKALYYRKKHHQSMLVLLPLAILLIGMLIYSFEGNEYFIYGVICGVIVGLAIGLRQYFDFMAQYKELTSE